MIRAISFLFTHLFFVIIHGSCIVTIYMNILLHETYFYIIQGESPWTKHILLNLKSKCLLILVWNTYSLFRYINVFLDIYTIRFISLKSLLLSVRNVIDSSILNHASNLSENTKLSMEFVAHVLFFEYFRWVRYCLVFWENSIAQTTARHIASLQQSWSGQLRSQTRVFHNKKWDNHICKIQIIQQNNNTNNCFRKFERKFIDMKKTYWMSLCENFQK